MKIYSKQGAYNAKEKYYHFFNNTYEFNFYVFFDKDTKTLRKFMGLEDIEEDGQTPSGRCYYNITNGKLALWFPNKRPSPEVVAHECLHAVGNILHSRGVLYDIGNDEPYTYLLTWFIKAVNQVMKK